MCHPSWARARTAAQRLRDLVRLRRVRDRIDREYAQPLDVEALARGVSVSAGHLSRQFRLAYGESPYAYLMTRRVERAMALLRRGDLSVTEVCFAVGCASLGTFSTRFTELVGVPPDTWAETARATGAAAVAYGGAGQALHGAVGEAAGPVEKRHRPSRTAGRLAGAHA
ncbi:helix-turn-helix transcriptional regulator [Micromonospora sp. NPDC047670]|uniref:helix-turn-helix transcriptional regulator n=1 Tax=Micromonospora sp. NPDC047670 TaxID=3364252 RepID=UPI003712A301